MSVNMEILLAQIFLVGPDLFVKIDPLGVFHCPLFQLPQVDEVAFTPSERRFYLRLGASKGYVNQC